VRVPHPRDVARELQESLTTLLGKRQVSEDDVVRPEQRKGKRPRPQPQPRSKVRLADGIHFFSWINIDIDSFLFGTYRRHLDSNRLPWPEKIHRD
jgi:hypothetical protein